MLGNLDLHKNNLIVSISLNLSQDKLKIELFEELNLKYETAKEKIKEKKHFKIEA